MSPQSESFAPLSNAASLSNAALIDRCRDDDELAFAEIFWRHRQMVYRICLRYLGHHHDAEDITQETFRRAALAMPHVDACRPLEPWLVTIAANRCRSFLTRRRLDRAAVPFDEASLHGADQADSRPGAQQRLATNEQLEIALARLPAQQRQAFEFVHRNQLTYPETAERMGCPTGTVKTWVRRAKKSMQHSLCNDDDMPDVSDANSSTSSHSLTINRGLAAGAFASLCLLGWFGFSPQQAPLTDSVGAQPSLVISATPSTPVAAPQSHADAAHWQWVSLDAFSRTRLNAAEIEALPVAEWVSHSTPTLEHLRSGFTPLGSALQRVARLFQGELASIEVPPTLSPTTILGSPSPDQPAADTVRLDELFQDAGIMRATFTSVT